MSEHDIHDQAETGTEPRIADDGTASADTASEAPREDHHDENADAREAIDPSRQEQPAYGNPGLPVASVIFGIVGLILGGYVSWLLSVLAGIVAIALSIFARKQNSPWPAVARAGLVMGIVDIVASVALVGIVLWRLSSIGLI